MVDIDTKTSFTMVKDDQLPKIISILEKYGLQNISSVLQTARDVKAFRIECNNHDVIIVYLDESEDARWAIGFLDKQIEIREDGSFHRYGTAQSIPDHRFSELCKPMTEDEIKKWIL